MRFSAQALERLLAALHKGGYEVGYEVVGQFCELFVAEARGEPERFRARLFVLEEAAGEGEVGTVETLFDAPVEAPAREGDVVPLSLGYTPRPDLFVGWPAYDALEGWDRRRFPVPNRALREAEERGWADPLTSSAAYAFRPERAPEFLRLHRRTWGERDALRRRAALRRRVGKTGAAPGGPSGILYGKPLKRMRRAVTGDLNVLERRAPSPPPRRAVETGFSTPQQPGKMHSRKVPLTPGDR